MVETETSNVLPEDRSFEALLEPLLKPGYELALTMLDDPEAARDALQEAAFRAWRKRSQFRGAAVRPWFLAIVANQCRAIRRGRWWSVFKIGDPKLSVDLPEDRIAQEEDLRRAIMRLRPRDRLALFLRFYMDMSDHETARVLGSSVSAARARIHRALARLRPILDIEEAYC